MKATTADVDEAASNYYSVDDQDYYLARLVHYSKRSAVKHHVMDRIAAGSAAAAHDDDTYWYYDCHDCHAETISTMMIKPVDMKQAGEHSSADSTTKEVEWEDVDVEWVAAADSVDAASEWVIVIALRKE